MNDAQKNFRALADKYYDEILKTASDMLKIPSVSGNEKDMAEYTFRKMRELGYDDVRFDRVGNVIGLMKGSGGGKSLMYNCHLDTVEPGDQKKWKYGPFSGAIEEGKLWGRGASDTKATFAIQLYTPYILKKENLLPRGDSLVVGVVCEETSAFGSMNMAADGLLTDFAIVGEATENDIAVASRGRIVVEVKATGKSCHASIPHTGVNPFDFFAKFLPLLPEYEPASDELFGKSTMTPTKIVSSEEGTNLVPGSVTLTLDYRSVPSETNEAILQKIQKLADRCSTEGIRVELSILMVDVTCYNGYQGRGLQGEPSYAIPRDHLLVRTAKKALEELYGREVRTKPWAFATDCGHFSQRGVAVMGFSPAEIRLCHTTEDCMDLAMLREGIAGYLAIADRVSNIEK
ncbi:MAG: M20/M25/M40 family metallo-hydrolase [Fusobacteriaceae bacterium]|jgi:putative selenium metabolism hydrolase|nr:M20/M25/M40 family metallo-hydrolase [Fusobacteriaceae bacterium]